MCRIESLKANAYYCKAGNFREDKSLQLSCRLRFAAEPHDGENSSLEFLSFVDYVDITVILTTLVKYILLFHAVVQWKLDLGKFDSWKTFCIQFAQCCLDS